MPLPVSPRVAAIVKHLPIAPDTHASYADIGHDLGHIPLAALTRHPRLRAIAVELQPEAVPKTQAQLAIWGIAPDVAARLELRTGDGLAPVAPGEVEGALLAGLGERTMLAILESSPHVAASLRWLVCCPPTLESELRPGLAALGWRAETAAVAVDRGRVYEILLATRGAPAAEADPVVARWGRALLDPARVDPSLARAFLDDAARRHAGALSAGLRAYGPGSGKEALAAKLALLEAARARLG